MTLLLPQELSFQDAVLAEGGHTECRKPQILNTGTDEKSNSRTPRTDHDQGKEGRTFKRWRRCLGGGEADGVGVRSMPGVIAGKDAELVAGHLRQTVDLVGVGWPRVHRLEAAMPIITSVTLSTPLAPYFKHQL